MESTKAKALKALDNLFNIIAQTPVKSEASPLQHEQFFNQVKRDRNDIEEFINKTTDEEITKVD
jgi:hypothetical protein